MNGNVLQLYRSVLPAILGGALLVTTGPLAIGHELAAGVMSELRISEDGDIQCVTTCDPAALQYYVHQAQQALADGPEVAMVDTVPDATASIRVTYMDFPMTAQEAFQSAVDMWASLLESDVGIEVLAIYEPLTPNNVLGAAGSTLLVSEFEGGQRHTWYGMALANKLAGEDLEPTEYDIIAYFNSAFPLWHFDVDSDTPRWRVDFRTVVLHELCHGLGFFGSAEVTADGLGAIGFGTGSPVIFDRFAQTRPGRQLTKENKFPNPSLELRDALLGDQILFRGNRTLATTKGSSATLFTNPVWLPGSSYSHLDEATYPAGSVNGLMTPALALGESYSEPGDIAIAILEDIGWDGKIKKPLNPARSR